MSYNFQKWYYTILFTLFLACAPDEYDFTVSQWVADELKIDETTGLQFDDNSVYAFHRIKQRCSMVVMLNLCCWE